MKARQRASKKKYNKIKEIANHGNGKSLPRRSLGGGFMIDRPARMRRANAEN